LFADEQHYPCAINQGASADSDVVTLFNIVMDLAVKRAEVRMGRLLAGDMDEEKIVLSFSEP
jgi:hypothetical protein